MISKEVDSPCFDASLGIRRVMQQPVKHPDNPILEPDQAWEHGGITGGTLLQEDGLLKMWYRPHYAQRETPGNGQIMRTAIATSKDGIHWEKPNLGLIEYEGSKANNLVFGNKASGYGIHAARILRTPEEHLRDPARRYKMLLTLVRHKPPRWGFGVAFSPDGIHWMENPEPVLVDDHKHFGSFNTVFFDPLLERYVAYFQRRPQQKFPQPFMPSGARYMGRMESTDFLHWTDPNYLALGRDDRDPIGSDLFEPAPFLYDQAGYAYLNCVVWYDEYTDQSWIRLASSRDDLIWRWVGDRKPFIPLGPDGSWDSMFIHPMFVPPAVIVATRSEEEITPDLDYGIRVEILDELGHVIPGFTRDDCDPVREDNVRRRVSWNGNADVSQLAGKPIKLHFYLRFAKLYAFQFRD